MQAKETPARERDEKSLTPFEQAFLVKLDKVYNYQLGNDEEC